MKDQIIETWFINNRINLYLIKAISNQGMNCTLSTRGGRTVAQQFAHLHNVRMRWLEVLAKDLSEGLKKIEKEDAHDKNLLKKSLETSGNAIADLFKRGIENDGRMKGFRRGVVPLMGYFIAHDAHHRGSILLTLKQCGHKVDQQTQYGIWEWDKM
ncbi:MAG TPA: DinB family protein [Bacteroidia bacterium]|nr:DinB family protein [Bacteroidia bacterium]